MSVNFTHVVSEDGLSLTTYAKYPGRRGGTLTMTMVWGNLDEARENYDNARNSAEKEIAEEYPQFPQEMNHNKKRLWRRKTRFGYVLVTVGSGPPTWYKPRWNHGQGHNDRYTDSVMVGWLRAYVEVDFNRRDIATGVKGLPLRDIALGVAASGVGFATTKALLRRG